MILASRADMSVFGLADVFVLINSGVFSSLRASENSSYAFGLINVNWLISLGILLEKVRAYLIKSATLVNLPKKTFQKIIF